MRIAFFIFTLSKFNFDMGIFNKLFGKKEQKESLDQGLEKTKQGFFE